MRESAGCGYLTEIVVRDINFLSKNPREIRLKNSVVEVNGRLSKGCSTINSLTSLFVFAIIFYMIHVRIQKKLNGIQV